MYSTHAHALRVHPTPQLSRGYSALGLGELTLPSTWDGASLAAFALAAGCSYASAPLPPLALLDFLASELQCVRSALAARRAAAASSAAAPPRPVSLVSELHLLGRLLSIPPFTDDALRAAPEKVRGGGVKGGGGGALLAASRVAAAPAGACSHPGTPLPHPPHRSRWPPSPPSSQRSPPSSPPARWRAMRRRSCLQRQRRRR